jgi:hypothetical protein
VPGFGDNFEFDNTGIPNDTAAGADTSVVEDYIAGELGADSMTEVVDLLLGGDAVNLDKFDSQIIDWGFGEYFVYAPKKPLEDNISGIAGFAREALVTEMNNTAVVSAATMVSPSNNVKDPIRKVTRNIWTSTSDFKNVELFGSELASYDAELTFEENVNNLNLDKEKASFLKVLFLQNDPAQDQIYPAGADALGATGADVLGRPLRRNKFILRLPFNTEDSIEFQKAKTMAFFNSMFKPSTRESDGFVYTVDLGMQEVQLAPQTSLTTEQAIDYFKENGWAPNGWIVSTSGLFVQIANPENTGYHPVETSYPNHGQFIGWSCYFDDQLNKPVCTPSEGTTTEQGFPVAGHMGDIEAILDPNAFETTYLQLGTEDYTINLPKIGIFDPLSPFLLVPNQIGELSIASQLPEYELTDHTFEIGLPFPIINFNLSNLSANSLLGNYDIIFNDVDRDRKYEEFVANNQEKHTICTYNLVSGQMNKAKDVTNPVYRKINSLNNKIAGELNPFVNGGSVKKYLNEYVDNYSPFDNTVLRKNKNILVRDKEVANEVKKTTNLMPLGINISFANRQEPDFAKILSSTGYDVILMSKVAERFTEEEAEPPSFYDNDPDGVFFTSMIKDTVITDDPGAVGESDSKSINPGEPIPVHFLDINTSEMPTYDLVKFFDDAWNGDASSLTDLVNKSVTNEVIIENEETDFNVEEQFIFKKYSAQICKTELLQRAAEKTRNVFDIYSGKKSEHETLFFRIEKKRADNLAEEPIQNFFVFNDEQSFIEFFDTQVRYGVKYRYRIFAYVLVYGTQYQPFLDDPSFNMDTVEYSDNSLPLSFIYKPSIRLVELPFHTYEDLMVLDRPPLAPQIEFFPFKYLDDKIFISFVNTNGEQKLTPVVIKEGEQQKIDELAKAQKSTDGIIFESDDEPQAYEVFRTRTKPTSYMEIPFYKTINIEDDGKNLIDDVVANTDYWYFFRAIDKHGNFSNPTIIYQVRLIHDNVSYLNVSQFVFEDEPLEENVRFGKFLNLSLFGNEDELNANLLGKTLKIRIKSLETGKKVDLNIDFSKSQITNPQTETN